ncbi:MAG: hypothetical protein SFW66_08560 [Gammaproteobacteria bacterium]|nr:hypothetical protein [Gammaproteobacteria bacterium]
MKNDFNDIFERVKKEDELHEIRLPEQDILMFRRSRAQEGLLVKATKANAARLRLLEQGKIIAPVSYPRDYTFKKTPQGFRAIFNDPCEFPNEYLNCLITEENLDHSNSNGFRTDSSWYEKYTL